jgi:hypothetical protein
VCETFAVIVLQLISGYILGLQQKPAIQLLGSPVSHFQTHQEILS